MSGNEKGPKLESRPAAERPPEPVKTAEQLRADQISLIEQKMVGVQAHAKSETEIGDFNAKKEEDKESRLADIQSSLGVTLSKESRQLLQQRLVEEPVDFAQQQHAKLGSLMAERAALEGEKPPTREQKIADATSLIGVAGGIVDRQTGPYKSFRPEKQDRFLIQKGTREGRPAVFKVGELKDSRAIQNETRNLGVVEHAQVKPGQSLDVHFVRQLGETFQDEKMVGLAT